MNSKVVDDPLHAVLSEGETLLWQGPIGFNFMSSPVTVLILVVASGYVFWVTWGSYSAAEFCAGASSGRICGAHYWIPGPGLLAMAAGQGYDMLERRALTTGKAKGTVLLTSRRLIRVSDWPWRRVRGYDYRSTPPRWGLGGVIRFSNGGNIILPPDDAKHVRLRMAEHGKPTS